MDAMHDRNGIPKFDLAEQIMSEQRKNASVRRKRKAPARKAQPPQRQTKLEPIVHTMTSQPESLGQEQIVADIVAKDIERLCRSRA